MLPWFWAMIAFVVLVYGSIELTWRLGLWRVLNLEEEQGGGQKNDK